MKSLLLKNWFISILIITSFLFAACDKESENDKIFNFVSSENVDSQVYDQITKTCETYWDLENMIDSTFEIIGYGDEYSVHCDGISDGELYHFVIHTDSDGNWINDGRSVVKTSNEFLDITNMISYNDFESVKTYILSNGDRQIYCNMYNDNPHYSFSGFETYLNPEIGQLNINCDSELSDFNEIVIRDQDSDPQYFHLLIVRVGDLDNEQITRSNAGLIEGKIYLLKYYDYELDEMADKVKLYINKMIENID